VKNAFAVAVTLLGLLAPGASSVAAEPLSRNEIYNNFSSDPENRYNCCGGYSVSTPDSGGNSLNRLAMPFVPSVDGRVRKILLALSYISGANQLVVSLRADSGGLPGETLDNFHVADMPPFGNCCHAMAVSSKGVPVTAGSQYWVVVKAQSDTFAVWNHNTTGATAVFAFNHGEGWELTPLTFPAAFKVLGD
jgi:hypothetical protein